MLFKNLRTYRLPADFKIDVQELEAALSSRRARPCTNQELSHIGFAPPVGKGDQAPLVHPCNDVLLIRVQTDSVVLPSSVVKDLLSEKVAEIEEAQARKVYKRERDQLKDELILSLLPRAFHTSKSSHVLIDTTTNLVYCDSSTANNAEDMLSIIREVLGSFPVRPIRTKLPAAVTLTTWVQDSTTPDGYQLQSDCNLVDTDKDGGAIRAKNHDLSDPSLLQMIADGKQVSAIRVGYREQLTYMLDANLAIKGIKYEDMFSESVADQAGEDKDAIFDSNLTVMSLTFREMLPDLMSQLGGEDIPQGI